LHPGFFKYQPNGNQYFNNGNAPHEEGSHPVREWLVVHFANKKFKGKPFAYACIQKKQYQQGRYYLNNYLSFHIMKGL
jgi:hypothetical protein